MISYNELSQAISNDIIRDDDVIIVENLELEAKFTDDKKVRDGVKIEDEGLGIDDCSIDFRTDYLKCMSLGTKHILYI